MINAAPTHRDRYQSLGFNAQRLAELTTPVKAGARGRTAHNWHHLGSQETQQWLPPGET